MNNKIPVLRIRDANGNFIPINAIRGDRGKSAYEQAKEGGYKGTEQEFIALLNGLTSTDDADHYSDFSNPHNVTAEQTGAIPILYPTSADLNTELTMGGNRSTIHCYYEVTLNTPYKEGKTDCTHGMVITNAHSSQYGTQLCLPSGEDTVYVRRLNGSGISEWVRLLDITDYEELDRAINSYEVDLLGVKDNVELLGKRVTPIEFGGTGAITPEEALANLGLKRIVTGSYKGSGTSGPTVKVQIPLDSLPEFMIIKGSSVEYGLFVRTAGASCALQTNNDTISLVNGLTCSYTNGIFSFSVWRTDSPQAALNRNGSYAWTAILS